MILTGYEIEVSYAQLAVTLGMTEAAIKKAAQRLRGRYREILREQIAQTVDHLNEVEDEIRALFAILPT